MVQSAAGLAMNRDDFDYLMQQIARAREALGNALGVVQDIGPSSMDLEEITRALAQAVKGLYRAETEQLRDSGGVGYAMDNLRYILQNMQDVLSAEPEVEQAAATVAKILATLYPVYKALPEVESCDTVRDSVLPPGHSDSGVPQPEEYDDERRSSPRIAIEADIGFTSESNFFTGFSMDISSGGLFVATYDMPEIGTHVNLNFKVPDGPVVSVDGIVRWIREYNETTPEITPGIGVKFENLSEQDKETINGYMTDNPPMFHEED